MGSKRNVLVTGGAGYIGSRLVILLLSKGYNVIVYDNLSFGEEFLIGARLYSDFKLVKGDISDFKFVDSILARNNVDAIVHLAAIVGDPACVKYPKLAIKVNYDSSVSLYNCAVKHKVKKFVFASTCSNYGKMLDSTGYVNETSPLRPISLYAELKVKTENYILRNYKKAKGFCPTILRFATAYGVSPRMRFDLTVNEFTKQLFLGKELIVFGEKFWRPYCHVYDISRAILKVLETDTTKVSGNVFNIGDTKENYQKQMIVDLIRKRIPKARVKFVYKNEDPRDYKVDFSKFRKTLSFKITKRVVDGIDEVITLLRSGVIANPDDRKYQNV